MKTNRIYFEKHLNYDNEKLIRTSELRRKVVQAIDYRKNGYDICTEYYEMLKDIMNSHARMKQPLLFVWDDNNSTCWKFEQLHILQLMATWAHDTAVEKDTKDAKPWFEKAVRHGLEALRVLQTYTWRDSTNSLLPIMQDRYHLACTYVYASDFYYNIYTYKQLLYPIKKSFQMMELASRLWKGLDYEPLKYRHALSLKHTAEKLEDDQCGERVALMEKAIELDSSDEIQQAYNLWKQQNDSVYFNEVVTEKEVELLSLKESFENMKVILGTK